MRHVIACIALISLAACEPTSECPVGMIETDGSCRLAELEGDPMPCGPGTHFDSSLLLCVPDLPPTVCDLGSTLPEVGPDGVAVCVGSGGCEGCDSPIACPSPDPGKVTVCGRVLDTQTREPIAASDATGARCTATTADGPCALSVAAYDALTFAGDPTAPPLQADDIVLDDCGRYRIHNVPLPFNESLGIAVDDAGDDDAHALTGIAIITTPGTRHADLDAFATDRATDAMWTATADDPFGTDTFSEVGVVAMCFRDTDDAPATGVTITAGGSTHPDDDFYFSDADTALTTIDPARSTTGPNGCALLVSSSLTQHAGVGGAPAGCSWPPALAAAIPGVVLVQDKHLECE